MTTIIATKPELAVMRALDRLGIAYEFQSKQLGAHREKGSAVVDFLIPSLGIAISVLGEYWHFNRPDTIARDKMQQIALESRGIKVIYIDASDVLRNPLFYVAEALRGVSHSKFREL